VSKIKRASVCIISVLLAILVFISVVISYAYFSRKEIYDGYLSGQIELLFDRLNATGLTDYGTAEGITADGGAEWGTKENPYVISDVKHLYNLSELQRLGYFYKKHLQYNTEDDLTHIPYFLVCTPSYTPVVIDGSSFDGITAIGTNDYPFIGSVKGVSGTEVTVGDTGNTCATSVIHNVSVEGNPFYTDAGLFGHVGFLGELPADGVTEFAGTPSVISNLVLSDVTVSVQSKFWAAVEAFVEEMAFAIANGREGHRYSYTELYGKDGYETAPHENHHIGILAGHVEYSTIELVSVFYSSGSVVAMDLSDTTTVGGVEANYLSAAGIVGYLYNMNPKINEENGNIIAGSGDSLGDLSYDVIGGSGGGGLDVGNKPGYILAGVIYNKYGYILNNGEVVEIDKENDEVLKISEATDGEGNPLCEEYTGLSIGDNGTSYYFYDGVFTFALSSTEDVIESTWYENVPPEFALGQDSADGWVANNTKGQKSVAAYLRRITSDADLQLAKGKPLVIMREIDAETAFMMSLYNQSEGASSGNFNERYTTRGESQTYATAEEIATFIESFEGSPDEFVKGFLTGEGVGGITEDDVRTLLDAVQNDSDIWKVINLDHTSGNMSDEEMAAAVQTLRDQFRILSNYSTDSYAYFVGNTPVTITDGKFEDYYDYASSGLSGYFMYDEYTRILSTRYAYYWIPLDGSDIVTLNSESRDAPNAYFTASGNNWQGENIYTRGNYTGVLVDIENQKFYSTNNTARANGASLTKPTGNTFNYLFRTPSSDYCYLPTDTNMETPILISSLTKTGSTPGAGLDIYSYGGNNYIILDRYYIYDFYANGVDASGNASENHLRMIRASVPIILDLYLFQLTIGQKTEYTLWNGNDANAQNTSNFKMGDNATASALVNSTNAVVKFNNDGTCYIQYTIDGTTQYVNYNGSAFNTALSATGSTKLCIYVLEYTQELNYGTITFDPNEESGTEGEDYHILSADEYVFWPEDSTVAVQGTGIVKSSVSGAATQYSVYSLADLAWLNGDQSDNGGILHGDNLLKKFRMEESIAFGANIGGIIGTGGFVRAPVGPEGTYTDIPAGCVAFRVNKTSTEPHKIRVVIAVPTSNYHPEEDEYELLDDVYENFKQYFCLWQMDESDGSGSTMFQASDYIERFEVPRSHPYKPGTNSESNPYVTATYNGEVYRSYLNGDRILVAYEFKVYNEGVYILGTSNSESDSAGIGSIFDDIVSTPMEIVYFSADGVADSGYDGSASGQLGTLDFVYSYGGEIVTVTERSSTDAEGNLDYSTYYQSYCLIYMNSKFDGTAVDINNEKVYVRRYVDTGTPESSEGYNTNTDKQTVIAINFGGDKYTRITQHSLLSDNVKDESP